MPTKKDLEDSAIAQFILGISDEDYYCNDYSREPLRDREYKPPYNPPLLNKRNSKKIGTVSYNEKTGRMIFTLACKKD